MTISSRSRSRGARFRARNPASTAARCAAVTAIAPPARSVITAPHPIGAVYSFLPELTHTYVDSQTGEVKERITERAIVVDEHAWRVERLADSGTPSAIGAVRRFRFGRVCLRYAGASGQTCDRYLGPHTGTSINEFLDPSLVPGFRYRDGGTWREVPSGRPDRIAFLLTELYPCGQDARGESGLPCAAGRTNAIAEQYVEIDRRSLAPPYSGGIAVFAEKRLNGSPAYRFGAESLEYW